ncbi:MAG: ATP-grasp domain-containing protein, partial [Planctomycetota bacterium]
LDASLASMPLAYCGSLGPIDQPGSSVSLSAESRNTVTLIAKTLARASGLHGLFGIDFVLDRDRLWMTELNPRYTASIEVLELARRQSSLAEPVESGSKNSFDSLTEDGTLTKEPVEFVAKAILYARRSFTAPDLSHFMQCESPWNVPFLADVPAPGTVIDASWPICTVFANSHSPQHCLSTLTTYGHIVRSYFVETDGPAAS